MEIETKIEKTIKLRLTIEETLWLKDYFQNGLPDEDNKTKIMREAFWNLINSELNIK